MDVAAARPEPIPVYAEMGSINPIFVLADALEQRAEDIATGLHGSVTAGSDNSPHKSGSNSHEGR